MKLTSILMLGAFLQVSAHVHSQTVTFSGKNVPLEKVFASVEKQTGYVFFFDEAILQEAHPVSIQAENYPLPLFLNCVLNGQPLKYSFQNKTIVISRKELTPPAPTTNANPETPPPGPRLLHGLITDGNGSPLTGASVTIKGSGKSALTNGEGTFNLIVPTGSVKLIISYIGYTTREITIAPDQKELFVLLTVAVNALDEQVVQGYGKTSQRLSVANIYQVSGEEIQRQPTMNPLLALDGKVPGMLVTPTSGYASAPIKVEIRGRNTLNPSLTSDPLYVIDGVPLTIMDLGGLTGSNSSYTNGSTGFIQAGIVSNTRGQNPLFSMNPADIESITVLKDAAATSIYGSRGANGVVLITTRKARPGKTQLNIQIQQSMGSAPRNWSMLNTAQYVQMRREALKNDGAPITADYAPDLVNWDTTRYTDWQKKIWGVAKTTGANMSLSGGDNRNSFILGAGYVNSKDITTLAGTNQRLTFSSNLSHRSADQKLSMSMTTMYSYSYVNAILMPSLTTLAPNTPPIFTPKGDLNYADWNAAGLGGSFPFASIKQPSGTSTNFLNSSINLNYALAKGWNLGIAAGYSNAQTSNAYYNTIASQNPIYTRMAAALFGNSTINNWNIDPQLNYATYIGKGKLEAMAGGSWQNSFSKGLTIAGYGITNDALISSPSNASFTSSGSSYAPKKYASVHGRLNYNWLNTYILELDGNRDGSSIFGPGRQFGNFWSAGAAWIASEEEWFHHVLPSWWSFLKLNGSYGVTGLDAGGAYQYLSQWSNPGAVTGGIPYNGVTPLIPTHAVNQDYQWQENRKINADLTLGFLKDRITLELSYYQNRCNNQLTNMPTPAFTGFTTVFANSPANVQNMGWEASLKTNVVSAKDFSWTLKVTASINRNKLLSYPDFQHSPFYTTQKIGKSLNTIYLFHYVGVNPQTGLRSFTDYNHDGLITTNASVPPGTANDDRYIALDLTPSYIGGITSLLSYKRCMLYLFFSYKKQMGSIPYVGSAGAMGNVPVDLFTNRWQKPGDNTQYPRLSTQLTNNDSYFGSSDGAYTNTSYLRLNTLTFSYAVPEKTCKYLHMQGINLSVNMANVFTITPYKGIDPEIATFGNLPQSRVIAGSISLNL